jgi:hypothetical protein
LSPTHSLADTEQPIPGNYLMPGDFLLPLDRLFSPNGLHYLMYQADGNVALWHCPTTTPFCSHASPNQTYTWTSRTYNNTPGIFNMDPRDGYLHVWSISSSGPYVESAYFGNGRCGGNYLKIQDDGNLVIYRVNPPGGEISLGAVWQSSNLFPSNWTPPYCP